MKRSIYIVIGCVSVALGAVGAVLPVLPTVPFLLLAAFCFARSSQRLHNWFTGTKLYKKNLEIYVNGRGMTLKTKLGILSSVTALMAVGFIMMKNVPVGRTILAIIWVLHVVYFLFGVKTIRENQGETRESREITEL